MQFVCVMHDERKSKAPANQPTNQPVFYSHLLSLPGSCEETGRRRSCRYSRAAVRQVGSNDDEEEDDIEDEEEEEGGENMYRLGI